MDMPWLCCAQDSQQNISFNSTSFTMSPRDADFLFPPDPFHRNTDYLLQNSAEGKLSTSQLRMAYSALVRCASASGLNVDAVPEETLVLAWYCIQLLLDAIASKSSMAEKGKQRMEMDKERLNRLHLTLISTIPSLPLVLMLRVLEEIKIIITSLPPLPSPSQPSSILAPSLSPSTQLVRGTITERNELIKALFDELIERVGYREKSAAMQWWYQNRMELQLENGLKVSAMEKDGDRVEPSVLPAASEVAP